LNFQSLTESFVSLIQASLVSKESRKVTHEAGRDPMFRPQYALFGGQNFTIHPFGSREATGKGEFYRGRQVQFAGQFNVAVPTERAVVKRLQMFPHFQAKVTPGATPRLVHRGANQNGNDAQTIRPVYGSCR
jgi:hypothetical protein